MTKIVKNKRRFIEKLGIKIDNIPRNYLTINLVNNAGFNIRTPITFTMGENDLGKIVSFLTQLGFPGKRVAKALVRSIEKLARIDLDEIKNNFWCVGYTPEQIIRYAQDVMIATMTYHHIPVIPLSELTKDDVKRFVSSFGGYRGVEALFTDIIEVTCDEFRRIQKAEAILNKDKIESEISSDQLGSIPLTRRTIKTQCLSCKHCHTDRFGYRSCYKKALPVPKNLTVDQVNAMYPRARIYDCNLLKSHFIMHEVQMCDEYVKRP